MMSPAVVDTSFWRVPLRRTGALGRALVLGGTDVGGGLRLDQVLQRRAQQLTHHIAPLGLLQHTEQGQ